MLAVVLTAGLFPNAGTVQAQSSCPYGGCATSSSVPVWEYVSILVIVAVAAILALLFIMRRRRPPRAAPAVAAGAAAAPPAEGAPPWGEQTTPAGTTPSYLETPEDVGHAPPPVEAPAAPPAAPAAGAAAGGAAGAEGTSDIDSLMAELDRISGEILKKSPKKGSAQKPPDETEESEPPS